MTAVDAIVVGAGVAGLTTAISLAEAGLVTEVVTAQPPSRTTSAAAGAIWGPVRCGPPQRCLEWARASLPVLLELEGEPAAGVRRVSGREVSAEPASPPEWVALLPGGARMCAASELPSGFTTGWHFAAPVVTMPVYLDYLLTRYTAAGGTVSAAEVASLSSLSAPVVVNCSGIGARDLVPDPDVVPVRGQVVVVRNPGIEEFFIDHTLHGDDYVYLFPHGDVVLLGGTAEEGAWDLAARPAVAARIVRDCAAVYPRLRDAEVVGHRVGLRPCRPSVRLDSEDLGGGRVLWHNYGHGGGGVTLSWGCAREITEAVLAGACPAPVPRDCGLAAG
jgi:D-amino-acid oxidase